MLKSLFIKNIALIDEANIEFSDGLNVLSGETGAGKSIIIDSLAFVLGQRADKSLIKSGENTAFVEAVFLCPKDNVFEKNGYLADDGLFTVSRTMSVGGKNEIRINGRISNLAVLKQISASLADIFGQNEQTYLLKQENHLSILDGFGSYKELLDNVAALSEKTEELNARLKKYGGNESERERMVDMLRYQINEIDSAEIHDGEDEELLQKKQKAQSAEKISFACSSAINALDGETSVVAAAGHAATLFSQITNLDKEYSQIFDRLESLKYEAQDIAETLEATLSSLNFDQAELDVIETRLDKLKLLKKKYGGSLKAVEDFSAKAKEKLEELLHSQEAIDQINKEKREVLGQLYKEAALLSQARKDAAERFESKITTELTELGMKNTTFKVVFNDFPDKETFNGCGNNGLDVVEFYFSANKGEPIKPLAKIISGGEMSRFMLALKNITASIEKIPTMVFDEVDAGISGKIAEVVGKKLAKVSHDYQCLVITHLPQIASMSDVHFLIEKSVVGSKTKTAISKLDEDGKIKEIARLLGGDIGDYGELHAKDMISWANNFKRSL